MEKNEKTKNCERRFYGRCPYCLTEMMSPVTSADKYISNLLIKPNDPIVICQKCIRVFPVVETTKDTIFDNIVTKYINATNFIPNYIIPVSDQIQDNLGTNFKNYEYHLDIYAVIHRYKCNNINYENIVAFVRSYENHKQLLRDTIEKLCSGFCITDDCVDFKTSIDYINNRKSLIGFNDNVNGWLASDGSYLYYKKLTNEVFMYG